MGFPRRSFVRFALGLALTSFTLITPATAASTSFEVARSKVSIRNFGQINENYFRGSQPRGRDFGDLAALGVKTVIDLTQGDLREEQSLAQASGMKFFRLPMVTTSKPSADTITKFLQIVNDPANQPVYVHCAGGRHRTGVVTAAYRMTHDAWSADQAFAEMRKFDFEGGWINHAALKSFVYDYYTQLKDLPKPTNGVLATVTPITAK